MKRKGKLIIGITGGIGSGKTLVSKMLARRGFKVYYADKTAKDLYLTDKKLVNDLKKVFGKEILNFKGKINLPKLKDVIFANKKNYETINKIVHPVVISHLKKEIRKSKYDLVLVEAAILFESGFNKSLDYVVTVYSNKKTRIERLMVRDESSKTEINHLMKFQIDEKSKMEMSDFVIMNNKSIADLKKQVDFLSMVLKALQK
ncbi:MAG TPA: dephospho-CoA kinase [Ignavibacteria bacterium]|nr:dephospho-CoA kinase [Ignavibacteria bacterium]